MLIRKCIFSALRGLNIIWSFAAARRRRRPNVDFIARREVVATLSVAVDEGLVPVPGEDKTRSRFRVPVADKQKKSTDCPFPLPR